MASQTWYDLGIQVPSNASGNVKVTCPQCSHGRSREHIREKCLSVDVERGLYRCHHCEWAGRLDSDDHRPIPLDRMARVKQRIEFKTATIPPEPPRNPLLPDKALEWFAKRGIPAEIVQRFGIYAEQHYFPGADAKLWALAFPYRFNGQLINVKYRAASAKHFVMVKDARKTFFNLDAVRDAECVVIVEGEMDVLAMAVAGIKAISVPNGANSLSDDVMESARPLVDRAAVRFVLSVDNDDAGWKLESELMRRLGVERCARVTWPSDCKDANDVLMQQGAPALARLVDGAVPYPIEGIVYGSELSDRLWNLYADGLLPGALTGWDALDGLYTVQPGEMTIVTGIPGSGKSAWVDCLCVNLARNDDWRFAVYSPENQPLELHQAHLIAKYIGAPFSDGPTPRMTPEEVDRGERWIGDHFAFILPGEPTIDEVLTRARVLVYRMGVRGLVIDPWNEMEHNRPTGRTETEYIGECLTKIRRFARLNRVHVWVVAHPTKMQKGADGKYPVPTPYDISGSSHWYAKADNIITVDRDKLQPVLPSQIHVQKIRHTHIGKIGLAELRYDPPTGRFLDLPGGGSVTKAGAA